jgi:hypothetical protein
MVSISAEHVKIEAFSAVSLGEAEQVMRYNQMAADSR